MTFESCRCRAHSQHLVFRYLWDHPSTRLKAVAKEVRLTYLAVRLARHRLMIKDNLHDYCPICFTPSLQGLVCTNCGAELDRPQVPTEMPFDSQSPVHSIQPGGGLGSHADYDLRGLVSRDSAGKVTSRLRLTYGGVNIKHLLETSDDPLLERSKSLLWEVLKGPAPPDDVVEQASRLLVKEVREFEFRYPELISGHKVAGQLVQNVLRLVVLRYPRLKECFGVSWRRDVDE
jgi:hypothetical protein